MPGIITERDYLIHYYEIDFKKRVLLTSIINYFNDVGSQQNEDLGITIDYLNEKKITWVLYKWDIDIIRYPLFNETISVKTSAYSFNKFYAYRTYEIRDSNHNIIGSAKSTWILINIEKRKPMRIPKELYTIYGLDLGTNTSLRIEDIKQFETVNSQKTFNVRYSDIDTNKHVNNVKYAAWCIESVPLDIVLNNTLKNIKVTYKKETRYGNTINVQTDVQSNKNEIICVHRILNSDGKELTIAQTTWIPNL